MTLQLFEPTVFTSLWDSTDWLLSEIQTPPPQLALGRISDIMAVQSAVSHRCSSFHCEFHTASS